MMIIFEILARCELQFRNTCLAHSMWSWTQELSVQMDIIPGSEADVESAGNDAVANEGSVREPPPEHLVVNGKDL